MIVLSIFLAICLFFGLLLSFPVRIRFESSPACHIDWVFLKIKIFLVQGTVKTEWKLFNKSPRLFTRKQIPAKKPVPAETKPTQKKKEWSITKDVVMESLADTAVKKTFHVVISFLRRCLKAIRISFLHWNIGLKDCYKQGILFGLLHSLPCTKDFQVSGNFQEVNSFVLVLKISLWKLLSAVVILLFSIPYLKVFRLYRRVSHS